MTLFLSVTIAVLFGCGAYLLLKNDLLRLVVGTLLIANSANLFIMSAGLSRGEAAIYPLPRSGVVSDPLVQAMTLTSIVITFGVSALLLCMIYRVYMAHATLDTDVLADVEVEDELAAEIEAGLDGPELDTEVLREEAHVR